MFVEIVMSGRDLSSSSLLDRPRVIAVYTAERQGYHLKLLGGAFSFYISSGGSLKYWEVRLGH